MPKKVRLRDVTADNWEEVVDLKVSKEQKGFVASNAYSLAESKFDPYVRPRAIYAGERVVGFLMYETLESEDRPHEYSIYRLMIDKRQQGKWPARPRAGDRRDQTGPAGQAHHHLLRAGERSLQAILSQCRIPGSRFRRGRRSGRGDRAVTMTQASG